MRLSALVVVHNEAGQLAECLSHLDFVDEIVVVLDRCTDASRAIALGYNARLVEGAWPLEGDRRSAGQAACSGHWILEVDADERVRPALAEEIVALLAARESQPDGADWWRIPFDNYVGTRLVRHGWGAQIGVGAKAVLFRKGVKHWGNERVHPKVRMDGQGGGPLSNSMAHYLDRDVSDMIQRLDRYSTLHAEDLRDSGDIGTFRRNVLRIAGRFWKCFVRRKGYREGSLGFIIAVCAGLYPILSYVKARYDAQEAARRSGT